MAIELTEFANVDISVSPTGVASGNFGILGFLTNELGVIGVAERARAYTSLTGVGDDWATTTEVYKAATAFYAQTPTPLDFTVLMAFEANQAAVLTGGGHDTLAELILINGTPNGGNFNISVDGTDITIADLDLSAATTLDEVATAVEDAITAANAASQLCTVVHTGYGFEVKSLVSGVVSVIGFADGTVGAGAANAAEALGLEQHQGKVSDGIDAETAVGGLAANLSAGIEFIGLVTHKKYRDVTGGAVGDNTADVADWAEAAKKIFCNTTNNLATLSSAITTDIGSVLKTKTLRYTLTSFSKTISAYPSASVFGRVASVNFEGISTTITANLKQMPTIASEDLTPGEFAVLRSKNVSAVVQIGKSVNAYTDSRMASGSWLDTTHGLMWLENRCETDMFNFLYQSATKVPYTQAGINSAKAVLDRSLQAAVRNGLAGPGFLPDGTYLPEGYRIRAVELADVSSGDKGNRVYQGLAFDMVGAGALHEVIISGTFAE